MCLEVYICEPGRCQDKMGQRLRAVVNDNELGMRIVLAQEILNSERNELLPCGRSGHDTGYELHR